MGDLEIEPNELVVDFDGLRSRLDDLVRSRSRLISWSGMQRDAVGVLRRIPALAPQTIPHSEPAQSAVDACLEAIRDRCRRAGVAEQTLIICIQYGDETF
ncbi:MAG: hypothetical protein R3E48_17165 [Burkholderiaceae bacterium]